ncbi:MAG: chemotaxis protein CheR [Notoacmeibacter sp.]|nr:chemotaxis protein CheR [Notoacmeibacter sp.]
MRIDDDCVSPAEFNRLREADFNRIAALIGSRTGIKLPPAKRLMVEGRLRRRVRSLGFADLTDYCRFLFEENGLNDELVHVIDAVTTNKTDFFREEGHFTVLANKLVPSLLSLRRAGSTPKLKLWSAASSNGAEAYTIAMVLADLVASRNINLQFVVLGTDISTRMLAAGEKAVYPAEMIGPVPAGMKQRYLMHGRSQSRQSEVRIVPELRRHVRFRRLNLMDESYPVERDVDVIFLRNVLIYFEKETQEVVVSRLMGHLRPGGFLVLGHSESMIGTSLSLTQWAPGVFQKPTANG